MLVHRSFLSIFALNLARAACNALSCSSDHESSVETPFVAGAGASAFAVAPFAPFRLGADALFWLNVSMHSSRVRGISGRQTLLIYEAIWSQRFAPPGGNFFTPFANADISSFVKGFFLEPVVLPFDFFVVLATTAGAASVSFSLFFKLLARFRTSSSTSPGDDFESRFVFNFVSCSRFSEEQIISTSSSNACSGSSKDAKASLT
mmetsp:Transcript_2478/g.5795  ORF Transcript_2478/g.5795 Transcript_2478/m.5795 type:complete len:205 (-) Transcript_2478:7098-7712(-)